MECFSVQCRDQKIKWKKLKYIFKNDIDMAGPWFDASSNDGINLSHTTNNKGKARLNFKRLDLKPLLLTILPCP